MDPTPRPATRPDPHPVPGWRRRLHDVIFEADTAAGKAFDVVLLLLIATSLVVAMLDSMASVAARHHDTLVAIEWGLTVFFTVEYVLRLVCVRRPLGYALSFFGVIDLLAVLPTYLTLVEVGWHHGTMVRALRLLRIFRVFKLASFVDEADTLRRACVASGAKITVFFVTVVVIICLVGSVMYLVEGPEHGFTSIPQGIYWAVVTVTTVGYGDISPATPWGRVLAALVMLLGYSILIIPGGIISSEWARGRRRPTTQACPDCSREGHDEDAVHCKWCGGRL